jgi:HlyD family secretion protein
MRRTVSIIAVLGAVAVGAWFLLFSNDSPTVIRYKTAVLERGAVVSVVNATGTVSPVVAVQVGTQVSGMIKSLNADFNSVVKAGDVIAQIDPAPFQARRDQTAGNVGMARAAVSKARVDLTQRTRELERMKGLLAQQFVSQNDVDMALTAHENAQAQLKLAEAQLKQAEAILDAAELDLKYTTIRSPVKGIVIARNVEVGQTVAASFATPNLFLIALDLTQMQVDTNVSEADIGGIAEGKEAVFTVDAYPGEVFRGKIRQVRNAPINVQNVVTYNVVVGVENQDLRLKPGMTANVSIVVAQRDQVLKVPNAALRFVPPAVPLGGGAIGAATTVPKADAITEERGKTLWRLGSGDQPEAVPIQPGLSDGLFTEIAGATLQEGDRVIIGLESPRSEQKTTNLPPGFGSAQRRSGRDRNL